MNNPPPDDVNPNTYNIDPNAYFFPNGWQRQQLAVQSEWDAVRGKRMKTGGQVDWQNRIRVQIGQLKS